LILKVTFNYGKLEIEVQPSHVVRSAVGVLAITLVAACGDSSASPTTGSDATDPGAGGTFIAFTPAFEGWRTWEKFPLGEGSAQGQAHLAGPRTEYLNKRPPTGSTTFPVGTIIVKELEVGELGDRKVFAMVKRGGDYNAARAPGWEWFELHNQPDGTMGAIVWRGFGPPAGEQYGGDKTGCASCHMGGNDFVHGAALALSSF
jgi:hypothetical protein